MILRELRIRGGGYYVWPAEGEGDKSQNELIKNLPNIINLPIQSKNHGVPIPSFCLPYILTRSDAELTRNFSRIKRDKPINRWEFAFYVLPLGIFIAGVMKSSVRAVVRKIIKG